MEKNEEYHDPDYAGTSESAHQEPPPLSEENKYEKIKQIIHREFSNELEARENEITVIDQRLLTSRRYLHRLRYALVSSYYTEQKLQLTSSQIQDEVASQVEPRARTEVSSLLRDGQRRLHPSVRKLLGKQTVDIDEIFKSRAPRNKIRKDYVAMLRTKNYTIPADSTKSLRPEVKVEEEEGPSSRPTKVPRHLDPPVENVLTLDELTRNKMKHRYRIIIGNTSKYAPGASRADRSTHKWLLYVRGAAHRPDVSRLLSAVTVRLHHSYAPHHTVHLHKPPFHVSRRGWGEFPAQLELHFALPERNRPALVSHTIKLDRHYTGMQVRGAETVVDVWLYSTPEMLEFEYKEEQTEQIQPKTEPEPEPEQETTTQTDSWLDFFSKDTQLDVDEMLVKNVKKETVEESTENIQMDNINCSLEISNIKSETEDWSSKDIENPSESIPNEILCQPTSPKKRIMKYMDPTTGKIYYLELDRTLDLTKVQEIVINSKGNVKTAKISPIKPNGIRNFRKPKKGVSLLKPEVTDSLRNDSKTDKSVDKDFTHIENDHCYLGSNWRKTVNIATSQRTAVKSEQCLYSRLCECVPRMSCVRVAVNFLLNKIPVVSDRARDSEYLKCFPFTVESVDRYWTLDFAKRRNIEWSRAKLINRILKENFTPHSEQIWRTKQILIFARLHGYFPTRPDTIDNTAETEEWSSWNDVENSRNVQSNIREHYPNSADINTLTNFDINNFSISDSLDLTESDDEVEIVECDPPVATIKKEIVERNDCLEVMPVESEEDRLRFLFIERKSAEIGVELRNEDVGNGYSYSMVHAVMLSALKSFTEELVRSALAERLAEDSVHTPVWAWSGSARPLVSLAHVLGGARARLRLLANDCLGSPRHHPCNI